MTTAGYRRLLFVLSGAVAALLLSMGNLALRYSELRMEAGGAWLLIAEFQGIRSHLSELDATGLADRLNNTVRRSLKYKNASLKRVVEHERALLVRDLIANLRKKTGEDLGEDPSVWISKYLAVSGPESVGK